MSNNDFWDFGFSAVDLNELEVLQEKEKQVAEATGSATETQEKLDAMYKAIQPLLNNLKANPEKDYIFWPGRMPKIESFEAHLAKIYYGK
jgi:hypothetical protein